MRKPNVPDEIVCALRKVRRVFVEHEWYFSVVDLVGAVLDDRAARTNWKNMKRRNLDLQLVSNLHQLKIPAPDGKYYQTDVITVKQIPQVIIAIPSSRINRFKLFSVEQWYWLLTGDPMSVHPGPDDLPRDDDGIDILCLGDLCNILERHTGLEQGPFIFVGNHPDGRSLVADRKLSVIAVFPALDKHHLVVAVDRVTARGWQPGEHFRERCREIRLKAIEEMGAR